MPKRVQATAKESESTNKSGPVATILQGNLKCVLWRNEGEKRLLVPG